MRGLRSVLLIWALGSGCLYADDVEKIIDTVKRNCSAINLYVVLGIIKTESNFKNLTSSNDSDGIPSIGYMQVKWPTAKFIDCGLKTAKGLYSLESNIRCGCKYLKYQLTRYKDYREVIAAYNAGTAFKCRTGKTKSGKACTIKKFVNQDYVDTVIQNICKIKKMQLIAPWEGHDDNGDRSVPHFVRCHSN